MSPLKKITIEFAILHNILWLSI